MMPENNDLHRLRQLTVLEPDVARSRRVRERCCAAIGKRQSQGDAAIASRRFRAIAIESGLTYGLSVGYLFAIIHDLVRLYMRR